MTRAPRLLMLAGLAGVASSAQGKPAPEPDGGRAAEAECARDDDCRLVSRTAGGCPEAVTRSAAESLRREQERICAKGNGPREICGPMPGCIQWLAKPQAACEHGRCVIRKPKPPEGVVECRRRRPTHQYRCSGVPPRPGEPNTTTVMACDGCATNDDCKPGGRCVLTGGQPCEGPAAYVCRYARDICDGCPYCTSDGHGKPLCRKRPPAMPPSAPPRGPSP